MIHVQPILTSTIAGAAGEGDRVSPAGGAMLAPARRRAGQRQSIGLKSRPQIDAMRRAGRIVRRALEAASATCRPGVTTAELDAVAAAEIERQGGSAIFQGYRRSAERPFGGALDARDDGFPATLCVSVNEEVVHGIPGDRLLAEGDLVTLDCGVRLDGWCADAAITVPVGRISPDRVRMLQTADAILDEAIALAGPGRRWSDIASRMERMAFEAGYGVVTDYVGHGIGRELHEPPQAPGFLSETFRREQDFTLRPGMVIAIEPMIVDAPGDGHGRTETLESADGWTVITADGSPAVHVEQTVAIVRDGAEVLTDGR